MFLNYPCTIKPTITLNNRQYTVSIHKNLQSALLGKTGIQKHKDRLTKISPNYARIAVNGFQWHGPSKEVNFYNWIFLVPS